MKYAIGITIAMFCASLAANDSADSAEPPGWYLENIQFLTADGGTWIADNSAYKSDDDVWDAYVIIWRTGPGGYSMSGRMFGVANGERSKMDFWLFSQFWNPVRKVAVVEQYGWGTIGIGTLTQGRDQGDAVVEQTFAGFDGVSTRKGHRSTNPSNVSQITTSYDIEDDGQWIEKRTYEWKRQR
jgi:hypothetical protein